MKCKFYSLALAALLCMAGTNTWAQTQISSAEELLAITDMTATYELTQDINMAGQGWTSLTGFAGTFDGQGHTIKNLGAPFCLTTEGDATIKNLTLESDEPIVYTGSDGGFGAFICRSNYPTAGGTTLIENCVNKTAVDNQSGKNWTGGFIGASNEGNTSATTTIRNCQNLAAVTSKSEAVAGFVGNHRMGKLTIENCTNSGDITAGTAAAGGFIGQAQGGDNWSTTFTISDSQNAGTIKTNSSDRCGGFVGGTISIKEGIFNRCWNEGTVTSGAANAGGFVGNFHNNSLRLTMNSCFNVAGITATSNAGALVGTGSASYWGSTVKNCWNIGAVSGDGFSFTSNITRSNCYDLNGEGTGITQVTATQVTGGELCYKLNEGAGSTIFYQNLDNGQTVDSHPVLTATGHGTVYKKGSYLCDGVTPSEGGTVEYSNDANASTIAPHTFESNPAQILCAVCQAYNPTTTGMSKDEADNYLIDSADKLKWFGDYVNDSHATAKGIVTTNIDMTGKGWTSMTGFASTFDGGNFTVKNLGAPFCSTTEGNATIKNLTLESDEPIVYTGSDGGFGAFICRSNYPTAGGTTLIENCVNKTAVDNQSGQNWTGGFIGASNNNNTSATATIRNCQNLAAISSTKEAVAGFVGNHRAGKLVIENCTNSGNITAGTVSAGGFIGQAQGGSFTISDSNNEGVIAASTERAGGIVGATIATSNATFNRCWNEGAVSARDKCAAGILGNLPWNSDYLTVDACFNIAPITANEKAGAIAGMETYPWYASTISNCWNIGTVSGNGFSSTNRITRSNCYDVNGEGTGITQVTTEQVESGEVAYKLNQGAGSTIFYQTIGTDEHPVLSNASAVVYKTNDAGISTYYGTEAVTFNGVNVYTGYVEGSAVKLTKQQNTIPAQTAVVIEGIYYNRLAAESAPAITGTNDLVGSTEAVTSDGTQYALALDSNGKPAFMKVQSGIEIPAGKAYLVNGTGVKSFSIGGGETGLSEVTTDNGQQTTVIYDLQGRRVVNATKGIYIINGKKVLR